MLTFPSLYNSSIFCSGLPDSGRRRRRAVAAPLTSGRSRSAALMIQGAPLHSWLHIEPAPAPARRVAACPRSHGRALPGQHAPPRCQVVAGARSPPLQQRGRSACRRTRCKGRHRPRVDRGLRLSSCQRRAALSLPELSRGFQHHVGDELRLAQAAVACLPRGDRDLRQRGQGQVHGACTNWAESFFARLRRGEMGHNHHIAGPYLLRYAQAAAWKEDNRRTSNGQQVMRVVDLALSIKPSVDFCGYWQRHKIEVGQVSD